jgi:hypothetical protein
MIPPPSPLPCSAPDFRPPLSMVGSFGHNPGQPSLLDDDNLLEESNDSYFTTTAAPNPSGHNNNASQEMPSGGDTSPGVHHRLLSNTSHHLPACPSVHASRPLRRSGQHGNNIDPTAGQLGGAEGDPQYHVSSICQPGAGSTAAKVSQPAAPLLTY